ncbi:MAG: hypothetical protein KDD25_05440 [Bdellovibrionales bacterium]|nr:hypothetical protein [Bdellovibrionales bacterium]
MIRLLKKTVFGLLTVSFTIGQSANASPIARPTKVIAKESSVSNRELLGFIKTQVNAISLQDHLIQNLPEHKLEEKLLLEFENAQKYFLSADVSNAIAGFKRVIELSASNDWSYSSRKIIHFCYLRLAQLNGPPYSETWDALAFDSSMKIDLSLIPPPVVEAYNQNKKTLNFKTIEIGSGQRVLVNGKLLLESTQVPDLDADFRITVIANDSPPSTVIWNPKEGEWIAPKVEPITGDCATFDEKKFSWLAKNTQILFKGNCVFNSSSAQTSLHLSQRNGEKAKPENRFKADKDLDLLPRQDNDQNPIFKSQIDESESWIQNKWVWIGAGALVAGFIIYNQSQSKSESKDRKKSKTVPTHDFGFSF